MFPIGELEKPKVRELAEQHGLITHDKKTAPDLLHRGAPLRFLQQCCQQPGDIISPEGNVMVVAITA